MEHVSDDTITEQEQRKYWEIFSALQPVNGLLDGDRAAVVLKNSRLPESVLARVWDLADIDGDGNLDFEEFCVAMHLIFTLINKGSQTPPATLPPALVPSSKAHLVMAGRALQGDEEFEALPDVGYEDPGLTDDFDWYMGPDDRSRYTAVFTTSCDRLGQLSFDALQGLYDTLNVPDTEIRRAWALVNPKRGSTIGKEQALYFLHALNQRNNGARLPRSAPASLRSTFERNQVDYNVAHARLHQNHASNDDAERTPSERKGDFAATYLRRMGVGESKYGGKSSDTLAQVRDVDWEEVRLRKELEALEQSIAEAEAAADGHRRRANGAAGSGDESHAALVKRECEQLLEFKQAELAKLKSGSVSKPSTGSIHRIRDDIDMLRQQVDMLQGHLDGRLRTLEQLDRDLQVARG